MSYIETLISNNLEKVDPSLPWKIASNLLFNTRDFKQSELLKRLWAKSYIDGYYEPGQYIPTLEVAQSLFYLEKYTETRDFLLNQSFDTKKEKILHRFLCDNSSFFVEGVNSSVNTEHMFADYVSGRNVRIIGPQSTQKHHEEGGIKIAFNVTCETNEADVSYYNKQNFIKHKKVIVKLLEMGTLKFAVVNGFMSTRDGIDIEPHVKERVFPCSPFLLNFNAALLAVPRCIYDMLTYNAKSVYVEGVDFFTHFPFHAKGYNATVFSICDVLQSWSIHDIFYNFRFVKRLYDLGHIQGDNLVTTLLEHSVDEYIRKIEQCVIRAYEVEGIKI